MTSCKTQRSTKKDMRYDKGQVKRSFHKHHEQPSAIEWIQQLNVLRLQFCSIMIMCVLGGGWMGLYVGVGWLPIAKCNHSSMLACLQLHVIPNHRHVFSIKWQFILRNISWQADFIFTYLMPCEASNIQFDPESPASGPIQHHCFSIPCSPAAKTPSLCKRTNIWTPLGDL